MNTKIETDSYGNTTVIANSLTAAKKHCEKTGWDTTIEKTQ